MTYPKNENGYTDRERYLWFIEDHGDGSGHYSTDRTSKLPTFAEWLGL